MIFSDSKIFLCLFIVIFYTCLTAISAEKGTADDTTSSYLEFRSELSADEMKNLEKALKGKDKVAEANAAWRLAAHHRSKGELKKAEELVKEFASTRDFETIPKEFAAERLRCILEYAHIKALNKDTSGSMALLSWAEMRKDDFQRAVSCVKYAEILLDMAEFERSEDYLKTADGLIGKNLGSNPNGAAIGQGSKVVDKSVAWRELRQNADALGREIEFEKMKSKYGASYALYVKLRRIQTLLKKSFVPRYEKEAMSLINEIVSTDPQSQFAAAAEYLKGEILASKLKEESPKKEVKEVKEYLEKFLAKQPDGLYRGEALMLLGKISLEIEWDAKESEKYYTSALDYFRKAREKRDALSLYAPMSDELKKQSEPTQKPTTLNDWKRIVYHDEDPLKLYNTANAPVWYANDREKNILFFLGLFQYANGKYDEAKKIWEKAGELDNDLLSMQSSGLPNLLMRLKLACEQKKMILSEDERKRISAKNQIKVLYGELLYGEEKFDAAYAVFESLLKGKSLNKSESIEIGKCRAMCSDMVNWKKTGNYRVVKNEWLQLYELSKGTEQESEMMWSCIANYMASTTTHKDALVLVEEYIQKFPKSKPDNMQYCRFFLKMSTHEFKGAAEIYKKAKKEVKDQELLKQYDKICAFYQFDPEKCVFQTEKLNKEYNIKTGEEGK